MQARAQILDTDWSLFVDELADELPEGAAEQIPGTREAAGLDPVAAGASAEPGARPSAWHVLKRSFCRRWF